jgi:NADPH-dependent 2,4-dienoyl-CoA reductase/sulfur reductase-like enzyme
LLNSVGLLLNPEKVIDAMRFLINLKREKLRVSTGRVITSIKDTNSKNVKRISVMPLKGEKVSNNATAQELDCDVIAISYGFTPDLTIPSILKLKTVNKEDDEIVMVDSNQRSSKLGVWAAGEITGVGGHELAIREGEIAALDILGKGGSLTSAIRKIDRWRKQIFASGLARVYKVSKRWFEWNADDVVVCRCEEVSRDEIINSFRELGADSVRTSKLFTRAGMGMCQGRLCHRNVQDIARVFGSESTKISRPIGGAVTLGELSD